MDIHPSTENLALMLFSNSWTYNGYELNLRLLLFLELAGRQPIVRFLKIIPTVHKAPIYKNYHKRDLTAESKCRERNPRVPLLSM